MGRKGSSAVAQVMDAVRLAHGPGLSVEKIQSMDKNELTALQIKLGLGDEWGVIKIPLDWLPQGGCRAKSIQELDFNQLLKTKLARQDDVDLALTTMTRYFFLCFFAKVQGAKGGSISLAPTTIARACRATSKIAQVALSIAHDKNSELFTRLKAEHVRKLLADNKQATEWNRMLAFNARGLWDDMPGIHDVLSEDVATGSAGAEDAASQAPSVPFMPFPDEFVAEFGWRATWLVENFAGAFLKCALQLIHVLDNCSNKPRSPKGLVDYKSKAAQKFLSNYKWKSESNEKMGPIPFSVDLKGNGNEERFEWPPRNLAHMRSLAGLLQAANLMVFLLSTGGRISEALSSKHTDLIRITSAGKNALGRTYKLEFRNAGSAKEWPLPDFVVKAVEQQCQLRVLLPRLTLQPARDQTDDDSSATLWGGVQAGKPITTGYNEILSGAVTVLGLDETLGDGNAHAHRFRKTIARLLALAMVGSPKILMDFFGHKNIEMTLHYILTDPAIRLEMELVAKAQTIMLAKDAIVNAEVYGGPARDMLMQTVASEKVRMGSDFGEETLEALAETLTMGGKVWQLVRPGIICTKLPQQAGACNHQRGLAEPASCQSKCVHRLESAALRDDVDRAIADAVSYYEKCSNADDPIGTELWTGQILGNLSRFPDIKVKWLDNAVVRAVIESEQGALHEQS